MYRMIYVYGGPGRRGSAAPNRQALRLPYGSVTPSDPVSTFAKRAVPLVISSPIFGVFAVIAACSEPRRRHVICSGVFAVPAVTAADVRCLVHSAAYSASSAEASRAR